MKRLARVLYSYDPEKRDELKLNPGELIEVLDEEEQGKVFLMTDPIHQIIII